MPYRADSLLAQENLQAVKPTPQFKSIAAVMENHKKKPAGQQALKELETEYYYFVVPGASR